MKFQTLSVVAGTKHCDAACPFCISAQTGFEDIGSKPEPINMRNLKKTLHIAKMANVSTAIITGKGEPTLFPEQVTQQLKLFENQFPFVELQTNAINIANGKINDDILKTCYYNGLTTILISNVGYDAELNRQTYMPKHKHYLNHEKVIERLHKIGFLVRMTCVGIKDGVDTVDRFERYLAYCYFIGADQVTWRPVNKPDKRDMSENKDVFDWTVDNYVDIKNTSAIKKWIIGKSTIIRKLVHGGVILDYNGQNVCLTDCLSHDPDEEEIRQLIFFPDGKLYTDWQYKGSRLL